MYHYSFLKVCSERETENSGVACPLMETIATNVGEYSYSTSLYCKVRGTRNYKSVSCDKRDIGAADIVRTYMYFLHLQLTAWMTVCKCPLVKLRIMQLAVVKMSKKALGKQFFLKHSTNKREKEKERTSLMRRIAVMIYRSLLYTHWCR